MKKNERLFFETGFLFVCFSLLGQKKRHHLHHHPENLLSAAVLGSLLAAHSLSLSLSRKKEKK